MDDPLDINAAESTAEIATWPHGLSEVCTALLDAGLRIDHFHEFAFSPCDCLEGLVEREPGRYYLSHRGQDVPLTYSISARRAS